jgi:hypothetical protein
MNELLNISPYAISSDAPLLNQFYHHIYLQKINSHLIDKMIKIKHYFDYEPMTMIIDDIIDGLLGYATIYPMKESLDTICKIIDIIDNDVE